MDIQVKDLLHSFKDKEILKGLTFTIPRGSICGLVGVNGAGKSTLMKILYGSLKADKGKIFFDEQEINPSNRSDYKLGALIERPAIYGNLSAFDNLKTKALLYQIPDSRIKELLSTLSLDKTGRKKASQFSVGMKQRLGLGMALLTEPDFLILDEPTSGLDPEGIKELLHLLRHLKEEGMTILISSHQLYEIQEIADSIFLLDQGKLAYQGENLGLVELEKLFFKTIHGGAQS